MSNEQSNKALELIADYYGGQLRHTMYLSGRTNVPPERVVEDIATLFLEDDAVGGLRWCEGYGHPHFWQSVESLAQLSYDVRCEAHQERRKKERRRP